MSGEQEPEPGGMSGEQEPQSAGGMSGEQEPQSAGGMSGEHELQSAGGMSGEQEPQSAGGVSGEREPQSAGGMCGEQEPQSAGGMCGEQEPQSAGGVSGEQEPQSAGGMSGEREPQSAGGMSGEQEPQSAEIRPKIRKNFKFIFDNLSGVMTVVTAMYGDSRITEGDFQTVEAETTNQKKTTKLLMLLTTKSDEAVISFMDALKSAEQDHIYKQIMDTVTTTHSDNHTDLISMDLKGALLYRQMSRLDNQISYVYASKLPKYNFPNLWNNWVLKDQVNLTLSPSQTKKKLKDTFLSAYAHSVVCTNSHCIECRN